MRAKRLYFFTILLLISTYLFADAVSKRDSFITAAKAYLGTPYRYGGTSKSGIDCSGLVYMAVINSGVATLPRTAAQMYNHTTRISDSELERGDLVFFMASGVISHVGIYLGSNQMLHSASDGTNTGVIISKLSERYWKNHYYGGGRFLPSDNGRTYISGSSSGKSTNKSKSIKNTRNKFDKYFNADFTGYFNWSFYTAPDLFGFFPKGGTIGADLRTTLWDINPGIFAKATYIYDQNNNFFQSFEFPMGLSVYISDYINIYAGVVLATNQNQKHFPYNQKEVNTNIIPGVFGIKFLTPEIEINDMMSILFTQDISYTNYTASSGYEALTFNEQLGTGISFNTGITFRLKF